MDSPGITDMVFRFQGLFERIIIDGSLAKRPRPPPLFGHLQALQRGCNRLNDIDYTCHHTLQRQDEIHGPCRQLEIRVPCAMPHQSAIVGPRSGGSGGRRIGSDCHRGGCVGLEMENIWALICSAITNPHILFSPRRHRLVGNSHSVNPLLLSLSAF